MKIVHLTSAHSIKDVRIFYKQCCSLSAAGYEVVLIAQADVNSIEDNISIKAIQKCRSRCYRMTVLLWKIYRQAVKEKADIYHFHDPDLLVVGLLLQAQGKKVIYDIHEDVPRDILTKKWLPFFVRPLIAKIIELLETFVAKRLSGIITVTPAITNRFSYCDPIEIRNYPLLNYFPATNKVSGKYICYAGLITRERGITEMIQVAEQSQIKLQLAGKITDNNIKNDIEQSTFVNFHGYINSEKLSDFYANALVGLILLHPGPTFCTSLPIKLFEYMAAGLPIIASNFPLWHDLVEKSGCGFCVNPFDVSAICEKIHYLNTHPELAKKMADRGREVAATQFNWASEEKKLYTLYQRLGA